MPTTDSTPYDALPGDWSDSARTTYIEVAEENPTASAAQLAALFEACAMIALADDLAATIPEHGLMTTGSTGQLVVNPAVAEVRALRRDAVTTLRTAGLTVPPKAATSASTAGAQLAGSRWHRR